VDVTELKVNESLHVRDINVAEGIRILTDADTTVVTIQPPISAEKLETMLAATPAAPEGEPELVKKPKKEGEAAAAPAAEAKAKETAPKETAPKKEAAPKK
jgi:large subunit ribosomal protein L25